MLSLKFDLVSKNQSRGRERGIPKTRTVHISFASLPQAARRGIVPLIAELSTIQTLLVTTTRAFSGTHAALEGSYTTVLSDTGRAPHRTTAHIIVQRRHSATMPRRRHPLILAALATAAALRQPPRRIAAEKTLRVLIADV